MSVRSDLTTTIHAAWLVGRQAYPEITITEQELAAFVGARPIGDRCIVDLYLAAALSRGDGAALAELDRTVLPAVKRGIAGLGLTDYAWRDLEQMLREKMLVRGSIGNYDGRAPLAIWLRVCTVRDALRQLERDRRTVDVDDDELEQLAPDVPDPELLYLRRLYGEQFRIAFASALGELPPRERNLLRHAVIDGLGIDQIAAIYHIHRATAARRLERARKQLIDGTRAHLRSALGVGETELESIMRALAGAIDVTLKTMLVRR